MKLKQNYSLKKHNTMKLNSLAQYFVDLESLDDLSSLIHSPLLKSLPKTVLGSGSNVLFTQNIIKGLVIKVSLKGKKVARQTKNYRYITLGAGENWHLFVTWAVNHRLAGIENLALIPGTVGAAPIQNIAAYGQNLSDVFDSLQAVNLGTGLSKRFSKNALKFSYRSSVFKSPANSWLITSVTLKLRSSSDNGNHPKLQTDYHSIGGRYDSLERELQSLGRRPYTVKHVYRAVINIRNRKLPNPDHTPTFGSFFKNPIVDKPKFDELQAKIDNLQAYPVADLSYTPNLDSLSSQFRIPAGRLLDELGWGTRRLGPVSTYRRWASVITHNGQASGSQILAFATRMQADVYRHYKIHLEPEVHLIPEPDLSISPPSAPSPLQDSQQTT